MIYNVFDIKRDSSTASRVEGYNKGNLYDKQYLTVSRNVEEDGPLPHIKNWKNLNLNRTLNETGSLTLPLV